MICSEISSTFEEHISGENGGDVNFCQTPSHAACQRYLLHYLVVKHLYAYILLYTFIYLMVRYLYVIVILKYCLYMYIYIYIYTRICINIHLCYIFVERKQLLLLGKILRCHPYHPLRQVSFEPGTYTAATSRYLRRVGRPRKEWIPEVFSLALPFTGSTRNLLFFVQNEKQWRQLVLNQ